MISKEELVTYDEDSDVIIIETIRDPSSLVHAILGACSTRYKHNSTDDETRTLLATSVREEASHMLLESNRLGGTVWERMMGGRVRDIVASQLDNEKPKVSTIEDSDLAPLAMADKLANLGSKLSVEYAAVFANILKLNIVVINNDKYLPYFENDNYNSVIILYEKKTYKTVGLKYKDTGLVRTLFCPEELEYTTIMDDEGLVVPSNRKLTFLKSYINDIGYRGGK